MRRIVLRRFDQSKQKDSHCQKSFQKEHTFFDIHTRCSCAWVSNLLVNRTQLKFRTITIHVIDSLTFCVFRAVIFCFIKCVEIAIAMWIASFLLSFGIRFMRWFWNAKIPFIEIVLRNFDFIFMEKILVIFSNIWLDYLLNL